MPRDYRAAAERASLGYVSEEQKQEAQLDKYSARENTVSRRFESSVSKSLKVPTFNHQCLARSRFFFNRDQNFLQSISRELQIELFPPGANIVTEGEMGDKLYFLHRGEVEILIGTGHTKVAQLSDGNVFGEMAVFGAGYRAATVRAMESCDCRVIHHRVFTGILKKFPKEYEFFMRMASERLGQTQKAKKDNDDDENHSAARASKEATPDSGPQFSLLTSRKGGSVQTRGTLPLGVLPGTSRRTSLTHYSFTLGREFGGNEPRPLTSRGSSASGKKVSTYGTENLFSGFSDPRPLAEGAGLESDGHALACTARASMRLSSSGLPSGGTPTSRQLAVDGGATPRPRDVAGGREASLPSLQAAGGEDVERPASLFVAIPPPVRTTGLVGGECSDWATKSWQDQLHALLSEPAPRLPPRPVCPGGLADSVTAAGASVELPYIGGGSVGSAERVAFLRPLSADVRGQAKTAFAIDVLENAARQLSTSGR